MVVNHEKLKKVLVEIAKNAGANDYESEITNADEIRQRFFPPFERLLNVTYAICSAVEQVN